MKGKRLWIAIGIVVSVVLVALVIKSRRQESATEGHKTLTDTLAQSRSPSTVGHPMNMDSRQVPAHYKAPPASRDLRPVLLPSQFAGKTRSIRGGKADSCNNRANALLLPLRQRVWT